MKTTERSITGRLSTRAQAGFSLAGVGAVLVALSMFMLIAVVPTASAHGGFPHGDQNCDNTPLQDERATGGYKVGINSSSTPPSGSVNATENITGVTWSISDDPLYTIVDTATSSTGYWLNYSITNAAFSLYGAYVKNGQSNTGDDQAFFTTTNPGSIEIPSGNSHIVLCFDTAGTTTSSSSTTTTTLGTTTSTSTSTTTSTTSTSTTTTVPDTTTSTSTSTTTTVPDTTTSTSTSTTTTVPDTTTSTSTSTTTTVPQTTTSTSTSTTTTVPDTTTSTSTSTTTTVPQTTTSTSTSTTTTVPQTTTTIGGPSTTTTTLGTTTTTTTQGTTTTVGGPSTTTTTTTAGSTTSTTGGTTTTVGGPCDPNDPDCLPNTGAGSLLWILLSGIGLLFLGLGILMIADERRRTLVA